MMDVFAHAVRSLHPSAHAAAKDLTPQFRDYAERHGASDELVPHLQVTWHEDAHQFRLGVNDETHQQAFDDLEFGGIDGRPAAFARGFDRELSGTARRLFDEHLGRQL